MHFFIFKQTGATMVRSQTIFLKTSFTFTLIFLISFACSAQKHWEEITSAADLCETYPEWTAGLIENFNLEATGLEEVKSALNQGNVVGAAGYLLDYYQKSNNAEWLRRELPHASDQADALADTVLNNVFVIQNVRGQVPYGEDGHRDWYYKGPNNDREWAWLSNRHSQISHVFNTYFKTGNPKYVTYIDRFLRDFIIKSMPYPAVKSSNSIWRGLEVSFRAKVWSRVFYGLLDSEYLTDATRLLILGSLADHAHYNRHFHGGTNWLTMEISALATVATSFPEYEHSGEWLDYSVKTMIASMKDQVYEDGVQTELTSHYHRVSLSNFVLFKTICDRASKTLPAFYNQTIEDMYAYLARTMRPDGSRILNNDGDRGSDRDLVLSGAKRFNNTEWEYLATNGKSGTKPKGAPSYIFPWAGQLISRSGFDEDAHWSFFDIGPWGSGHQHNDKLHISIAAYGRDLLVDAGRFAYTGEVARKFRTYARGSAGHNVILIDRKGQNSGLNLAKEPLSNSDYIITEDFDFATNSFDRFKDVEGDVEHARSVFYARGKFWIVVDRIRTDRPRTIEALWHWHPDCAIEKDGSIVKTSNDEGNLAIVPVTKHKFVVNLIEGGEEPDIQGWYSPEYNKFEPNIATDYSTKIDGNTTIVWLLLPSKTEMPKFKAKVVSEDNDKVKVDVKIEKNRWQVVIPFRDNKYAQLTKQTQ
jgi:hypothetical protein